MYKIKISLKRLKFKNTQNDCTHIIRVSAAIAPHGTKEYICESMPLLIGESIQAPGAESWCVGIICCGTICCGTIIFAGTTAIYLCKRRRTACRTAALYIYYESPHKIELCVLFPENNYKISNQGIENQTFQIQKNFTK